MCIHLGTLRKMTGMRRRTHRLGCSHPKAANMGSPARHTTHWCRSRTRCRRRTYGSPMCIHLGTLRKMTGTPTQTHHLKCSHPKATNSYFQMSWGSPHIQWRAAYPDRPMSRSVAIDEAPDVGATHRRPRGNRRDPHFRRWRLVGRDRQYRRSPTNYPECGTCWQTSPRRQSLSLVGRNYCRHSAIHTYS